MKRVRGLPIAFYEFELHPCRHFPTQQLVLECHQHCNTWLARTCEHAISILLQEDSQPTPKCNPIRRSFWPISRFPYLCCLCHRLCTLAGTSSASFSKITGTISLQRTASHENSGTRISKIHAQSQPPSDIPFACCRTLSCGLDRRSRGGSAQSI